jgi:hypothetical protein
MKTRKNNNIKNNNTKKNKNNLKNTIVELKTKKLMYPSLHTLGKYHKLMEDYLISLDITFEQYRALLFYKGSFYQNINSYLWKNIVSEVGNYYKKELGIELSFFESLFNKKKSLTKKTKEKLEQIIENIDSVFKNPKAKYPDSIVVYHGLNSNRYDSDTFNHKIGDIIKYKGYMSTSLNPIVAMTFSVCNPCCLYKINIPKKSNIIPLVWFPHYIKHYNNIKRKIKEGSDYESPNTSEDEFLLNRNSKIKVIDIYYIEPTAKSTSCAYKKIKDPSNHKMKVFECVLLS